MFGTSDPVDLITEGREKLAAEDRAGWSAAALGARIRAVAAERERLDAELTRLVAQWDALGGWAEDAYASPAAWLAHEAPIAKPAAARLVRSARHVARFEATGHALADGAVTSEKVEALAEAARHREVFYARDEQVLLDAAARLDARDLSVATRTWRMLADDELASADAAAAFDRVHLHVSNTLLGSVLAGFLDPQASALLTTALDLAEPPDAVGGPEAPRTLSQRRGEGLVKLAQHYLDTRAAGTTRAIASVEAILTVGAVGSIGADGSGEIGSGDTVDSATVDPLEDRSELEGFGPVPIDTILRLACESRRGWLVINGKREVLHLGRHSRTPTVAQRRAVRVRDRHCGYPGCRAPARWCDVHHLVAWERGGRTDLCNLVLLCRRHHVAVHEGGEQLVRDAAGTIRVERRARGPSG
jgi:hypothetical protein